RHTRSKRDLEFRRVLFRSSLLESFMPETSEKILKQLNTEKRALSEMDTFGKYPSGNKVTDKPEILFARVDVKEVMEKVEAMQAEIGRASCRETVLRPGRGT